MKGYVIQRKNGIIMNVGVSVKLDDSGSCKSDCMCNPTTCICECNKACKRDECLDINILDIALLKNI